MKLISSEDAEGIAPKDILSVPEFEELARACLPVATYEYLASGAADENTVRWNREAYDLIRLRPRVLRDVSNVNTTTTLLGRKLESPILLGPTAFLRAIHPEGEIAVARGAGAARTTWIVSTATTTALEEIAPEATSPLWFQLYVQSDRSITKDLAQRAEDVGCEALCLTVDTPVQGARNRQTRSRFALPAGLSAPYMSELVAGRAIADNSRGNVVTWDDVEWLQSVSRIPLLMKGILDADDADRAVAAGVSGIIVSNHGGRNLDTAPATIDALRQVTERVAGRVPVLVDGGIRRGTDIVKALAYGASAVLIGRPYCYGLAVAGADGVSRVIEILRTELEMTIQLIGCRSLAELDSSVLW